MSEEKKSIEVNEGDAMIIVQKDGTVRFIIPQPGLGESSVPENVLLISAFFQKLQDPQYAREEIRNFCEFLKNNHPKETQH